jgi:hypothetical protein
MHKFKVQSLQILNILSLVRLGSIYKKEALRLVGYCMLDTR